MWCFFISFSRRLFSWCWCWKMPMMPHWWLFLSDADEIFSAADYFFISRGRWLPSFTPRHWLMISRHFHFITPIFAVAIDYAADDKHCRFRRQHYRTDDVADVAADVADVADELMLMADYWYASMIRRRLLCRWWWWCRCRNMCFAFSSTTFLLMPIDADIFIDVTFHYDEILFDIYRCWWLMHFW